MRRRIPLGRLLRATLGLEQLKRRLDEGKLLAAQALLEHHSRLGPVDDLRRVEMKVFSQFGDDGIIQYLLRQADVRAESFVEIGVDDYQEANTRFLLLHDNWRGLVIDCGEEQVAAIRADDVHWRHDLEAVAAFVDRDNVNDLLRAQGFTGELGLLSIDVDGNDYWLWEAITVVEPAVVVIEYNAVFGAEYAVTIPYDPQFRRLSAHPTGLYWGSSLGALCQLARRKGYVFVGCNGAGNNAYFVREGRLGGVRPQDPRAGFRDSRFRESRGPGGELTFLRGDARREAIGDVSLVDVETGRSVRMKDLR